MGKSEESIERWKRALLEAQANADRAPVPEVKAHYQNIVESYTRLIASEATFSAMQKMMHKAIEDDPEFAIVMKYDPVDINLRDRRVVVRFDQIEISSTYPQGASIKLSDEELKTLPQWPGTNKTWLAFPYREAGDNIRAFLEQFAGRRN